MNKPLHFSTLFHAALPMAAVFVLDQASFRLGPNLYLMYWWYDIFMHGLGGFTVAWSANRWFQLTDTRVRPVIKPFAMFLLFLFCLTALIGIVWEMYEFVHDVLYPWNLYQISVADTMKDLCMDLFGAAVFCVFVFFKKK